MGRAPRLLDQDRRNTQLDALRCFAVLFVLWDHAGTPSSLHVWGDGGVRLFFVLSAFLITGILLRLRDTAAPLGVSLRAFYQRRFLRILPPYLALLGVTLLVGPPMARSHLFAHLTYLSNWLYIFAHWRPPLGHLWTLAVEEQFYLVWPMLVLLAPRRLMPWLFGGAVMLSIVTRPIVMHLGFPMKAAMLVTSASFDGLGLGALLAWHFHVHRDREAERRRIANWCLAAGALLMTLFLSFSARFATPPHWMRGASEQMASALMAVWLVQRCAAGFTGRAERVMESRPLVYVGRISYGIYLVQTPIILAITHVRGETGIFRGSVAFFLIATSCSIAVASVSWRYLEQPINSLKRRVPYPDAVVLRRRLDADSIVGPRRARTSS